ncbi:MAG: hypothetical protein MUP27_14915 [Desulfobacterales bacterium]|nr:hypothetical protein [Desulfobacterales bacterium]
MKQDGDCNHGRRIRNTILASQPGEETLPKQFLPIYGSYPLIYDTYRRVAPIVGDENIFLVINR